MPSINVLFLTSHVEEWLANSHQPRILHVFDSACNLINERREVFSVVLSQIGNGPFNLVVEDQVCFSDHLNLQSSVFCSDRKLALDELTLYTMDAKLWNPRPDWEALHRHRHKIARQFIKLRWTTDRLLLSQSLLSNLSSALVNADITSARKATSRLAGLGAGFTPSGDDFIMGALYATWIIHPCEVADALARAITEVAAPLTTSLSAAWLRAAGKGEAGILWHQLFDTAFDTGGSSIQQSIEQILSVGETSGADALAGFISTLGSVSYLTNL